VVGVWLSPMTRSRREEVVGCGRGEESGGGGGVGERR